MNLSKKVRRKIDSMSLKELLRAWRFTPLGAPLFKGESGVYFAKVMEKKRALDPAGWARASKEIGYEEEAGNIGSVSLVSG